MNEGNDYIPKQTFKHHKFILAFQYHCCINNLVWNSKKQGFQK